MNTLIIGHRGFVGSNLSRHLPSANGAGRKEIGTLAGQTFDNIYCAAPQAKKWWANRNPDQDWLEVHSLIKACKNLKCISSFILFSTVDVYDPPIGVDEQTKPSAESHPYGLNRFKLEQAVLDTFGHQARIVRLPALVGHGLKKNVIFDLINNNNINQINPNSAFQWFNLDHLPIIIDQVNGLESDQILNVASEPLPTRLILDLWFADVKNLLNWDAAPISYDVRTLHGLQGKPYLYSTEEILNHHLKPYIEAQISQS